jgi:hypothetical protein
MSFTGDFITWVLICQATGFMASPSSHIPGKITVNLFEALAVLSRFSGVEACDILARNGIIE